MSDFAFRPGVVLKHEKSTSIGPGMQVHEHGVHKDGNKVGYVRVMTDTQHPDEAHISDVRVEKGKNSIGASGVRSVVSQIKEHYPAVKVISGNRISGARGKATQDKGFDPEIGAPSVMQKIR